MSSTGVAGSFTGFAPVPSESLKESSVVVVELWISARRKGDPEAMPRTRKRMH